MSSMKGWIRNGKCRDGVKECKVYRGWSGDGMRMKRRKCSGMRIICTLAEGPTIDIMKELERGESREKLSGGEGRGRDCWKGGRGA